MKKYFLLIHLITFCNLLCQTRTKRTKKRKYLQYKGALQYCKPRRTLYLKSLHPNADPCPVDL